MLIASWRSHIPSSNYSTRPSLQTTTTQEATTAAAAKKERTRELPQDTYHTQKRHKPKEQKNKQAHTKRTTTQTDRDKQAYPPLLQTLKAVVLGINYPRIVRGIVVVFCVALIQNSLAVVIAVGGGRDSVRKRILPHFVGSCSKAKKQALLATTATSIARNAYKPPTEAFRKTASAKVRSGARTSPQLQGRSC
jgi:hypothetical protein